jgi:hypothetical protein
MFAGKDTRVYEKYTAPRRRQRGVPRRLVTIMRPDGSTVNVRVVSKRSQ